MASGHWHIDIVVVVHYPRGERNVEPNVRTTSNERLWLEEDSAMLQSLLSLLATTTNISKLAKGRDSIYWQLP